MLPVRTRPDLRPRVWGGRRLTPPGSPPVGEAWLAGEASRVLGGPSDGATLAELAAAHGAALTGTDAPRPDRFPLLAKILDPADWLSVQVHPDDEQARRLEGPDGVGKTEAWYVLDAPPGAAILLGVRPGVPADEVRHAISAGGLTDLLERRDVRAGEAYLVPPGTLHSIGPGPLVYEIQQPSDITYRCDDWGRPATAGRPLHIEQSLICVRPTPWTESVHRGDRGPVQVLVSSRHFVLEGLRPRPDRPVHREPAGASVHVLTTVAGSAVLRGDGWSERLDLFETLVVPADAGPYKMTAHQGSEPLVLLARLPTAGERAATGAAPATSAAPA